MMNIVAMLLMAALSFIAVSAQAQDNKVVVIPLNSSTGGPGNWKHV